MLFNKLVLLNFYRNLAKLMDLALLHISGAKGVISAEYIICWKYGGFSAEWNFL